MLEAVFINAYNNNKYLFTEGLLAENTENTQYNDFEEIESNKTIAYRLLNLYNQQHVIQGGIPLLNKEFVKTDDDIIEEIENIPGGKKLSQHIKKLKSGETQMDSIDPDLLPFGKIILKDGLDPNFNNFDISNKKTFKNNSNTETQDMDNTTNEKTEAKPPKAKINLDMEQASNKLEQDNNKQQNTKEEEAQEKEEPEQKTDTQDNNTTNKE